MDEAVQSECRIRRNGPFHWSCLWCRKQGGVAAGVSGADCLGKVAADCADGLMFLTNRWGGHQVQGVQFSSYRVKECRVSLQVGVEILSISMALHVVVRSKRFRRLPCLELRSSGSSIADPGWICKLQAEHIFSQ
jgi:hypothetical protein